MLILLHTGSAMKFGITYTIEKGAGRSAIERFHEAVDEIRLAETLGYDCAFVSEHHFMPDDMFPSPLIALAYIAARTSKIRLGSGVVLLPLHDPVKVAEDCAVLDLISGGRLILGIGQGYRPEEFSGFGRELAHRPGRMREGALLIRRLWTESKVTFRGKHFSVDDMAFTPKPLQKPSPPIWVAAEKRSAVELAAEIGDGWYADPITPLAIIRENVVHWEAALGRHGKRRADQAFAYYREWGVAADEATAWKHGGSEIEGEYLRYLKINHLVDDAQRPISPDREDLLPKLVRERTTIGDAKRGREDLAMIREVLNPTHVVFKMKHALGHHEAIRDCLRLTAEEVMSYFS